MSPRHLSDKSSMLDVKQQANDRSAQALRDNLRRRKAQARARKAATVIDVGSKMTLDEKSPIK